ncbi:alpha/beta hydrolase [Streptomyces sp. ID05-04B]|uniref:alpha/beta hydrolase n=2 Tax=unclassified Streptomyces TaxID=2593676 RepID=UPI000D1B377E|nr:MULTISPECIES: alpha/beta hydrolase [unclassified Streptomyces]AVV46676.1 alpha/beta hydrolase [Streptomyces sp. P3]MDX5564269.1 alpha/beta hydrolase [Streptomyces sp. ID05-04B]
MTSTAGASFETIDSGFHSHGTRCAARIYRPSVTEPVPVIVMAHGFGGVRTVRLPAYAETFAAAGYAVVLFDYRYFGDSDGQPRQLLDIDSQLDDWRSAVKWARNLPGIDASRVVGWGTSFAGGHVLTIGAEGDEFAAVIAQVPHTSGVAALRAAGLRASMRLLPKALHDSWRALRRGEPIYVNSVGVAGSVAVMTAPGADDGVERMYAESGVRRDSRVETVAARVVLRVGLYSPGRRAARITCPTLIQVATDDNIAPARSAKKAAALIRSSTFRSYLGGHFSPYVSPLFESVIADQLTFLRKVVPTRVLGPGR